MARLTNARAGHVAKWVMPAANKLLVESLTGHTATNLLSDVAHIEMGQSPHSDSINEVRVGVPLIGGPSDLGLAFPEPTRWTEAPTKLCRPNDIIVCVRATIGEPRWADGIFCLGRGVAGLRPATENLDRRFLFRVIQGNEQSLRVQGTGTTFKTISKKHLAAIRVPSVPLTLQNEVCDFLDWLEGHDTTRPDFAHAPRLSASFQAELNAVVRIEELAARIEEARGLRQRAVEEAKALFEATVNNVFQSIDTPTASLGNLASKIGSGSTPRGGRAVYVDDGIPFIRSQNVRMRRFQWDDIAFITPEIHASMSGTHVLPDDVLLNITGASIGRVACAPSELEAGNVNQHVAIIRPRDQEVLRPRYLMYWLSQPTIQDFINSEQKGATRQGFTKKQIEAFEIPLIPASNQDEIVSYLDALQARVEELKCLQAETAAELDALLPSILDKAFKGEL